MRTYFVLTFAVSWGGVLLAIGGPSRLPGTQLDYERLLPWVGVAVLAGPSVACLLSTALVDGASGFRELRARLTRWRVGARWYAAALLIAPALSATVALALPLVTPAFRPGVLSAGDALARVGMGVAAGLVVGFFEELGWSGFATPRLRLRHGVLVTGALIGSAWGAWHILTNDVWAAGTSLGAGALSLPVFITVRGLLLLVGQMPAFRVLTVWVYEHTGSLPVVMLMHASLSACTLVFQPLALTGGPLLAYCAAFDVATWLVVAAVVLARRGRLEAS